MGMYSEEYPLTRLEDEQLIESLIEESRDRLENKIWQTRDGRELAFEDMTDKHLENTVKMLLRNSKQFPFKSDFIREMRVE